jgi:hypothetical protein
LTPYNYAGNKPVTHIDIDGLQSSGDEKRNTTSIQSFTINQNEDREITSVSMSSINIVYDENGEIVSGVQKTENHEHLLTLKESDLYNSLNDELKQELNSQLEQLNPNSSEQEPQLSNNNQTTISSNDIEGQLPKLLSPPQKSSGDKISDALTIAGIGSGIGEYSSKATWGKYKNSKGKIVKIESLKESKGLTYKKQGNVKDWGNTKKLSKHAKKAISKSKFFNRLGFVTTIASTVYTWSTLDYDDIDAVIKASVDTAFAAIGLLGPIGFAISSAYFIADWAVNKYYPEGWKGLGKDISNNIMTIHTLHTKDGVMMNPSFLGK